MKGVNSLFEGQMAAELQTHEAGREETTATSAQTCEAGFALSAPGSEKNRYP